MRGFWLAPIASIDRAGERGRGTDKSHGIGLIDVLGHGRCTHSGPMPNRVLITGGAGFIGSHLADELLAHGHEVRVLDNLLPQVHGDAAPGSRDVMRPGYLDPSVELMAGDVRDGALVRRALRDVDVVFHLAAMVGVGQSMYRIADYTSANDLGTATLLEALLEHATRQQIRRLVVASSMSVYGEGLYRGDKRGDGRGQLYQKVERARAQLTAGVWEPRDAQGAPLEPMPTPETKRPVLSSVYALSKYHQEQLCLLIGRAYDIPAVALRFFNVYGTRQALSNPYTGVLAIFAARYLNNRPPIIFEDGQQKRDFVHVRDVARACRLAMTAPAAAGRAINVGSGCAHTIREVARHMGEALGKADIEPEVSGQYRVGDIRHCYADIRLAQQLLGYEPHVALHDGLAELAGWIETQAAVDQVAQAREELSARGLTL